VKKSFCTVVFCLIAVSPAIASVNPESDLFFKYLDRCRPYHAETTAEYNLGNDKFSYIKNIKGYDEEDMCEVTFTMSSKSKKKAAETFNAANCRIPRKKLSKLNAKNFDENSHYCKSPFK